MIEYIKKLGAIRQQQLALTRGEMELLVDDAGLTVYKRTYEDETIIVAINNTSEVTKIVFRRRDRKRETS